MGALLETDENQILSENWTQGEMKEDLVEKRYIYMSNQS